MKEIDEFKNENGGYIKYSVKELLGGLHKKVDHLKEDFNNHCSESNKKITALEAIVAIHTIIIVGLLWIIAS